MTFKKRFNKSIAIALVGVTVITPTLSTVSAMEKSINNKTLSMTQTLNYNVEMINTINNINDLDELIKLAEKSGLSKLQIDAIKELKETEFINDIRERKISVKVAINWLKKNINNIQRLLKKYLGINITTKGIMQVLDVVADISGTLDQLTYNTVDLICDTFRIPCSENMKWIISRALRLIMPF